jgi:excisionase family DNA binding protein
MFDQTTLDQLADAIAKRLRSAAAKQPERWPELMTIETAARYMDRTPSAIQNMIEAKMIPVCRLDRRVQLRRADLDRIIERKTA